MKKKIIIWVFSLLCAVILDAAILNVPVDYATIQAGMNAANTHDTVLVDTGTYVENINFNGKNITVASLFLTTQDTSYISQTVIDGDSLDSVVKFVSGEDSTAVLCGLTITKGNACGTWPDQDGGGIYCNESSPSLQHIIITSNNAENRGGGIFCRNSSPRINDLLITSNSADTLGGGVCCFSSSPVLVNVMIKGNSAPKGGGGFYCQESTSPILKNVSIIDNYTRFGGGIFCWLSSLRLVNVIIRGNNANHSGGGIHFWQSTPILQNITITGNSAGYYGGGIYCRSACPSLENVTLIGNSASISGGGMYCWFESSPILVNSISWNNTPQEIYFYGYGLNPNVITISYSDVEGGEMGIVTTNNVTVNWLVGNIDTDPLFVDPLNGNYHLTQDSPCVDAGTPDTTGLHLPPWDLDGNIRIWDGNGNGIAVIDMGAYEFGSPIYTIHEPVIPEESIIYNFPNPIKNSTTIQYSLKKNSHVTISIYNIKGQLVTTLVDASKSKGEYSVNFETKELSSGVYFYKMQTEDISEIKKMIVIK